MSDFVYTEEEVEVEAEAENSVPAQREVSPRAERALKRVLGLAAVLICGGLLWWLFIGPTMSPANVSVQSFPGLERSEALLQARIPARSTFAAVNAADAQALLAAHPLVESARVVKNFPDRISIYLEPRRAVAVALAMVNGRTQLVHFDRHGFAFMIAGVDALSELENMPVLSGLHNETLSLYLGTRLPDPVLPLLARIGAISDEDSRVWPAISEIRVAWNDSGSFDLLLYPVNASSRIRMAQDFSAQDISYELLILDALRRTGDRPPAEIDLRSGIGVFAIGGGGLGG